MTDQKETKAELGADPQGRLEALVIWLKWIAYSLLLLPIGLALLGLQNVGEWADTTFDRLVEWKHRKAPPPL